MAIHKDLYHFGEADEITLITIVVAITPHCIIGNILYCAICQMIFSP